MFVNLGEILLHLIYEECPIFVALEFHVFELFNELDIREVRSVF